MNSADGSEGVAAWVQFEITACESEFSSKQHAVNLVRNKRACLNSISRTCGNPGTKQGESGAAGRAASTSETG